MNAYFPCDLIRYLKTDSGDILRQFIGVFPHNAVKPHSVCIVYLHRQGIADPVLLQKDHRITKVFLFFHLNCYFPGFSFGNAFDLRKPFRFLLHNAEGIFSKFSHDSGCQCRTDPLNGTGTQIAFHGQGIVRWDHLKRCYFKLSSIERMFCIFSVHFQIFAGLCMTQIADAGQLFPIRYDHHNGIARFRTPIYHMIYITFYDFQIKFLTDNTTAAT